MFIKYINFKVCNNDSVNDILFAAQSSKRKHVVTMQYSVWT